MEWGVCACLIWGHLPFKALSVTHLGECGLEGGGNAIHHRKYCELIEPGPES